MLPGDCQFAIFETFGGVTEVEEVVEELGSAPQVTTGVLPAAVGEVPLEFEVPVDVEVEVETPALFNKSAA